MGSCENGEGDPANRTLYGYHGNGQLQIIYDALTEEASGWSDPKHYLQYHFDTAGNVIRQVGLWTKVDSVAAFDDLAIEAQGGRGEET